jgi:glutamate 5-kinase
VTKQACAAVGQSLLMDAYKELFTPHRVKIAQVLLTDEDFSNWRRYSNLRATIERLLGFGVLPIVNENDTVSTRELESHLVGVRKASFGDNDRLAALVMSGLDADALVLLTNVNGLLRGSEVVSLVDEITPGLRSLASGPSTGGRGGMATKLEAAEIAMNCGGTAVIANGETPEVLERIFAGEELGTTFLPSKRLRGKRRWIAYAADVRGRIVVDQGAKQALKGGRASLLSSGVIRVESHFSELDVVSIFDEEGSEFARGIAARDSQPLPLANPKQKNDSGRVQASQVLVRRDNIVLLETA